MFSIDMYKSYKFKKYIQLFVPINNEINSLTSPLNWLFYYIDKSSLEVSQDKMECNLKISFFNKDKLISEIDFSMNSNAKFWLSFTDNQLFFIKKAVKDIFTYAENLWVYIVPEKIDVHRDKSYSRLEFHRFKNFKVFNENFKFLYEIRDKGISMNSYESIRSKNDDGIKTECLITKEWFLINNKDLFILNEHSILKSNSKERYFVPFTEDHHWRICLEFKETVFLGEDEYIKLETWKNSHFEKLYNFLQEKAFLFYKVWKDTKLVYEKKFGFTLILRSDLSKLEEYWENKFLEWMRELGWNFSKREDKYLYFTIWYSQCLWMFFDISQYEKVEHLGWDEYWVSTKEGYRNFWKLTKDWNIVLGNDIKEKKDIIQEKEIERFSFMKSWWEEEESLYYIKTQWSKWLKKIYRDKPWIAAKDTEKEMIYFINNDILHRTSITFSFGNKSNELLEKKQFINKYSYHTMLVQDNWKFNYIF